MSGGIRVIGCQGCIGAGRDSRYSGARRDIGESGVPGGVGAVLGVSGGHQEVEGVRGVLRGWHGL